MTSTRTTTHTATRLDVARVLLRRRGTVYLPGPRTPAPDPGPNAGVELLETDAAGHGWLLSAPLRAALCGLDDADLVAAGSHLLSALADEVGASARHQPLFRGFPHTTPTDTYAAWVRRALVHLFQAGSVPCVLCDATGTVTALNPCGHLACTDCFDPADVAACPICYRRLDAGDPYLRAGDDADPARDTTALPAGPAPARLRVLHLGDDTAADTAAELAGLLARPTSLGGADSEDLDVLLGAVDDRDLSWLPETIPGRATRARVVAWLCTRTDHATALPAARALMDSATDVARALAVLAGGDAELVNVPRLVSVPRRTRRLFLDVLETACVSGDADEVAEAMARQRTLFKTVGQVLHPREHAATYPHAAAVFAWLRGSAVTDGEVAVPAGTGLRLAGGRVTFSSTTGQVDAAVAAGDTTTAVALLTGRPGVLLRRLDHLLRTAEHTTDAAVRVEAVLEAAARAARMAPATLLVSVLSAFTGRAAGAPLRVFLPKGGAARAHVADENRAPITAATLGRVIDLLTGELADRADRLPKVAVAHLDAGLAGVLTPTGARTASSSLVSVPRGSVLPVPAGAKTRLFLHWTEAVAGPVVDLDLSVVFLDENLGVVDECAYTQLHAGAYATHSGDFTSAPAPHGSSEFVDVDLDAARAAGVRYAVVSVYSFTSVPFDELGDAFAGVMALDADADADGRPRKPFNARAVEQRFAISGGHRMHVPFLLDVRDRTWQWLDAAQGVSGDVHATWNTAHRLVGTVAGFLSRFSPDRAATLAHVAALHAAARADEVRVRGTDGAVASFRRAGDETVAGFAARVLAGDGPVPGSVAAADLAFCLRGDVDVADGAAVYALFPAGLNPARVRVLDAVDVLSDLDG